MAERARGADTLTTPTRARVGASRAGAPSLTAMVAQAPLRPVPMTDLWAESQHVVLTTTNQCRVALDLMDADPIERCLMCHEVMDEPDEW
mgnify:CR=1 FL=1